MKPQRFETSNLVKNARKRTELTQIQFGKLVGSPQSLISKYECGLVDPPSHIVIHCMTILDRKRRIHSSTDVAKLVERRLRSENFSQLRSALVDLIESVPISK